MAENSLEIRTKVRMAQWQSIIKECKESGMIVAEFCEDRISSKSERTKIVLPNPDQLTLFDEVEQEAAPEPSEEATTVKAHKRKKQHTQKKLDLSKAERNVVVLDNSSLHYLCSGRKSCGRLWGLTSASRPWPTGFSTHTGIISNH